MCLAENSWDHFFAVLVSLSVCALENNGITTLEQLAAHTKKDVLSFQGMEKSSTPKLREELAKNDLTF